MAVEIPQPTRGAKTRQPRAKLRGSTKAQWLTLSIVSREWRSINLKHVRKTHRHAQCRSQGLAQAQFRTGPRLWFCELPDSASSEPCAASSEDDSDDYGALLERHDQRDQVFQLSSSDSTQTWSQMPKQSWQNRRWEHWWDGGRDSESHHRSPLSVVATLVQPAHQMAKGSRPFADEASKYTGAPSK